MKDHPLQQFLLVVIFFGAGLFFALCLLFFHDREFSPSENRILAQLPKWENEAVMRGEYTSDLEAFYNDQFVFRDGWVRLSSTFQRLMGQKEFSGVYLCKEKYLIETVREPDETKIDAICSAINAFARQYEALPVQAAIIPTAACILADKIPEGVPNADQEAILKQIGDALAPARLLNVTEALRAHAREPVFYRTDHHWTSLGAQIAFEAMAPELNITELPQFDRFPVSDSFEGTLASRSGIHRAKDTVEAALPVQDMLYTVTFEDPQKTTASLYHREALNEKDQYTVFFGGNFGRIDIRTDRGTGRTLLLFKDSYANCFVQYLLPCFDHIIMIDPRYYYQSLSAAMRREDITDVLLLYNCATFLEDGSLAEVLAS